MKYLVSEAQQSPGRPGWEYLGPVEMTRDELVAEFGCDPDKARSFVQVLPFDIGTRWVVWRPA
jgi:hypothetical protein